MEKLKKVLTMKKILIVCIISAILAVIVFSMSKPITDAPKMKIESMDDLKQLVNAISHFMNILYVNLFVLVIIVVACIYRLTYAKDKSLVTKMMTGANGITLLLGVMVLYLANDFKVAFGGDIFSVLTVQKNDFSNLGQFTMVLMIFQIVIAVASIYFCFIKKDVQETTTQSIAMDTDGVESTDSDGSHLKAYHATKKGKRNICIGVIGVVLIIACIGIYSFLQRAEIDLTSTCKLSYVGVSGKGTANIDCNPDYDQTNYNLKILMVSTRYTVENNGKLKNGDTVEVTAKYSKATAESGKISVKNPTKKFKVKGLTVPYKKFNDIPKKVSNQFEKISKNALTTEIESDYEDLYVTKFAINDMELIGIYYNYYPYNNYGTAFYLYRTNITAEHATSIEKTTEYYYVSIMGLNSNKKLDLGKDSDDIEAGILRLSGDKTDANAMNRLKSIKSDDLETVKEMPTKDMYKDETTAK